MYRDVVLFAKAHGLGNVDLVAREIDSRELASVHEHRRPRAGLRDVEHDTLAIPRLRHDDRLPIPPLVVWPSEVVMPFAAPECSQRFLKRPVGGNRVGD